MIKRNYSTVEGLLSESTCHTAEIYVHLEVPLLEERASVKLTVKAEKLQEVLQDMVGSLDTTLARSQVQGSARVAEAEGQGGLQDLERFKEDCHRRGQQWKHSVEKLRSKTLLAVGILEEDLTRSLRRLQALRAKNKQLQEELAACKAACRPPQYASGHSSSSSAAPPPGMLRSLTDRSDRSQPDPRRFTSEPGLRVVVERPAEGHERPRRLGWGKFNSDPPPTTDTTDGDVEYRFAYEPIRGIKVMLPVRTSHDQAVSAHRCCIDNPPQMAALQGVHPSVHYPSVGSAMSLPAQPTEQQRPSSLSATLGRFFRYARGTRSSSQSTRSSSQSPGQVPRAWP